MAERLELQQKHIADVLSIIKTQREVVLKLDRLTRRMFAEESGDGS